MGQKCHFVWQLWALISQAWKGLFGHCKCPKSAPGNTLAGEKGSGSFEPRGPELLPFKEGNRQFGPKIEANVTDFVTTFPTAISQAPSGLFQKFQHPWSIVCNCLTDKKGSRSKAPLVAELRPLKEGNRKRNLAKFDRYCSSMFKRSFLRPGGVFLRNSKTQNQQMGVTQPGGKSLGQNASQEGKLVPIKLCHPTQEMGNYTPKKPYLWSGVMFLRKSKTQNQ